MIIIRLDYRNLFILSNLYHLSKVIFCYEELSKYYLFYLKVDYQSGHPNFRNNKKLFDDIYSVYSVLNK